MLHDQSVKRLVFVERANHVVAIRPGIVDHVIDFKPGAFAEADDVEPMPSPLLAVAGRCEQSID